MAEVKRILVVGDWFVDEHWLMGIHRSSMSSRTGDTHSRALYEDDACVTTFCGAGAPASLLYWKKNNGERCFDVIGVGLWHVNDDAILNSMFCLHHSTLSPYQLTHVVGENDKNQGVELINLVPALRGEIKNKISTTRIVRIYHASSLSDKKLRYSRFDWEKNLSDVNMEYEESELKAIREKILEKKIDAVVIKDMLKGVISTQLLEWLSKDEKLSKLPWFVSSKSWKPSWLEVLKNVNLKLLIIPQVAAKTALLKGDVDSWMTPNGHPGYKTYNIIDQLYDNIRDSHKKNSTLFVVLPDEYSAIAYNYRDQYSRYKEKSLKDNKYCFNEILNAKSKKTNDREQQSKKYTDKDIVVQEIKNPAIVDMPITGMASIFLPVMVAQLMENNNWDEIESFKDDKLKNLIETTLLHTYAWSKQETEHIKNEKLLKNEFMCEGNIDKYKNILNLKMHLFNYETEQLKWEIGLRNIGAIGKKEISETNESKLTYSLDLWRATVEVNGYVCIDSERRKEIRRLIEALKKFKNGEKKHHVGCMLVADPGAGKTFLARKLAKSMGMKFLPFNITQMLKTEDILNCFDEIETAQSQDREQPILVFIDEINARMSNDNNIYGAFLAPLEEGIYIRNGKEFHISPCFWLFSGTERIITSGSNNSLKDRSDKKSDFLSRLTMGEVILARKEGEDAKIENVYIGSSLLINEFLDVRFISDKVLKFFYHLPSKIGIRDIKHLVKLFTDIKYNKVSISNLPKEDMMPEFLREILKTEKGKIAELFDDSENEKSEQFVEIRES